MPIATRGNNSTYLSIGSFACIILLLSGSMHYYFYMTDLSFDSSAYGQEQTVEAAGSKEETTTDNGSSTPPTATPTDDPRNGKYSSSQRAQHDSAVRSVSTEVPVSEDSSSAQSTGPAKFAFVDSFWTDYTSLGGVIASTSSESITAQPLSPVIKQEVEPGEGEAILAIVLRNSGFSDATAISGLLELPSGFRALSAPEDGDSDTALASYNGIVRAGQTFTLYFRVEITEDSEVGKEYTGELKINYFKVAEQDEEDTISTTIDIPFRLSGKVILSSATITPNASGLSNQRVDSILPNIVSINPGVVSPLKIEIRNDGSAIATGVIVNVLPSSTVPQSSVQTGVDGTSVSALNSNGVENTGSAPVTPQSLSSSSVPDTMVIVGSTTFNVGLIDANAKNEIVPSIFVANAEAGTISTLNVQILYNDAYGNKKTLNQVLGVQISAESPQSGLNVLPSTSSTYSEELRGATHTSLTQTSLGTPSINSTTSQGEMNSSSTNRSSSTSSNQAQSIRIVAGTVQDLSFVITNTNDIGVSISDVVVSLTSESDAVRVLGNSRWNLERISTSSEQELNTRVFASTSMIGSPVFFTVTMQYIRNDNELRTESFQLGAVVVGNIQISANDVAISYIGDTPNLVGSLLNEGNSLALFTKIEFIESSTQGGFELLRPTDPSSQFLGDLAVNYPVPFSIPLQIAHQNREQELTGDVYPISLRITYSDELRYTHELIIDETVSLGSIEGMMARQETGSLSRQNTLLNNGFVDAYWVDSSSMTATTSSVGGNMSSTAGTTTSVLPSEREVGPGEGPSFLAVVLSNIAFSDITGIIGYLTLPEGFTTTALPTSDTTEGVAPGEVSHTAIDSLSDIVKAGQTYTLYFKVNVLESAQKGLHEAVLRINYFNVPEPQPGTYREQTITVPFQLPGRVIFDASSDRGELIPGEANDVKLRIRNTGSADAHSVIVNINSVGGSIIASDAQTAVSPRSNNASNTELGTGIQSDHGLIPEEPLPPTAVANVGARTFNIGSISANSSAEIVTTIYPSSSAGGTLQDLDIEVSYNDANGNKRSTPLSLGFRILPSPPEGGLSVAPSSIDMPSQGRIILASTITGSPAGSHESDDPSSTDSSEVAIVAGRPHNINFNITNNNRNPINDIVVTLTPRSESLEILGDSRWTVQELAPHSKAQFPTRVFASTSLIGSPISFEVRVQYILGDRVRSDSFSLGGNVIGEIEIAVNDLSVRYIGDIPNLTGNLLNQGNTKALFTTIELQSNSTSEDNNRLVPITSTPQYLGDLQDNSPLPFNIPLTVGNTADNINNNSNSSGVGNYPISLRITYSDELRHTHEVILDRSVSFTPPQQEDASPNQGFLGFSSSASAQDNTTNSILPLLLVFVAILASAIVITIIVMRRRSRTNKISRLLADQPDNDDIEAFSSDEHESSSGQDQYPRKP